MLGSGTAGLAPAWRVEPGTVSYITTGAAMPPGADAVVKVEDTKPVAKAGGPNVLGSTAAAGLSEEETRRGMAVFDSLDTDGNGSVDYEARLWRISTTYSSARTRTRTRT